MVCNNPFALDVNRPYNGDDQAGNCISLEDAMKMIPEVGFQEFYEKITNAPIHAYLYDCYYMHYLCIIGDTIRLRNFIVYLRENGKDPVKVCNYNLLPEFNYGTCLHTAALWNSEPEIFVMLREICHGDLRMPDGNGFAPSESDYIPLSIYKNPFVKILGDGERVFDCFKPYRRAERDFDEMISYMEGVERELDAMDQEDGRRGENRNDEEELEEGEVVEEEEEEIEVILEHNNYNDFAADINNMNNENNNNVGPFDWNVDDMIIQDADEPQPLVRQNAVDYVEQPNPEPRINENIRNVRRKLF